MLNNLDSQTASSIRRSLKWTGRATLAAVVIGAYLLLVSPWSVPPAAAFTPMLGSMGGSFNGRWVAWVAAFFITALVIGGRVAATKERQAKKADVRVMDDVMPLLFLGFAVCFFSSITIFAGWQRLNLNHPAPRTELTVGISSVSENDEEPDCLTAYYFDNSAGYESWVCTEDTTPLKVGTKARVVEHKNAFGISVLSFAPLSTSSAKPAQAAH